MDITITGGIPGDRACAARNLRLLLDGEERKGVTGFTLSADVNGLVRLELRLLPGAVQVQNLHVDEVTERH